MTSTYSSSGGAQGAVRQGAAQRLGAQEIDAIIEQHRTARTPGVRLVQVIHVTGQEAIEKAERAARWAHAILLDSGNPKLATKELGDTGRRHDWTISERIRERLDVFAFLAGGLNPDNAAEAMKTVRPFGLDVGDHRRWPLGEEVTGTATASREAGGRPGGWGGRGRPPTKSMSR